MFAFILSVFVFVFFNWLQEMQQKGARTWRKLDKLEEKKYDHFRPLFFGPGQLKFFKIICKIIYM